MKRVLILIIVLTLLVSLPLSGCAPKESPPVSPEPTSAPAASQMSEPSVIPVNIQPEQDEYYALYKAFVDETLIPEYGVVNSYSTSGRKGGVTAAIVRDLNGDDVPELLTFINRTGSSADSERYVDVIQMYAIDSQGAVELRRQYEYEPLPSGNYSGGLYASVWQHEETVYLIFARHTTDESCEADYCDIYEMGYAPEEAGSSTAKERLIIAASAAVNEYAEGCGVGFPVAPAALLEETGEYSVFLYKDYQELYGMNYGKLESCENTGSCASREEALPALNEIVQQQYGFSYDELISCALDNSSVGGLEARGFQTLYAVDVSGVVCSGDEMGISGLSEAMDTENAVSAKMLGNTTANIMNGGSMTQYGDDVYFLRDLQGVNICSGRADSTGYDYLCLADAFYLNAVDDWLYFFCDDLFYLGDGPSKGIYKMRLDGSELTLLRSGDCHMLYVTGESIYAMFNYGSSTDWDLCVQELDLNGGVIREFSGMDMPEFALYDGDLFFWKDEEGICRLDTESGAVTAIVHPDISWFRVIEDKIFYIMESGNFKAVYMCDMDGSGSECVMPADVYWIKSGVAMGEHVLHCDGTYLYFFGTIGSYSDSDSKLHAYDMGTGVVIDLPIPSGYSFSVVEDWVCSADSGYSTARRYSKAELGLADTQRYLDLSAADDAKPIYSSIPVIKKAQLIYDMVVSYAGGQGGGVKYLQERVSEAQGYREKLTQAYEGIQFNDKVLAIEDLAIDTTLTIGSICTANATGAAAGVSATADAVISSAGNLLDAGLNRVIEEACLSTNDFVYCMTQMASTGTFALFASMHITTDRDTMTEDEARAYITAYYSAKMDMQTQLMGYEYFNEQLPSGFLEKLESSLTTAFFSLEGFIVGQYIPEVDAISAKVAQQLAKSAVNLFTGASIELFETVAMLNNDIITDWGTEMQTLHEALEQALAD